MIAPIRTSPNVAARRPSGPHHVGQLLPQVLARYGIVLTAAELAAFRPATGKTSLTEKALSPEKATLPRRSRRQPLERGTTARDRKVQLPLFSSSERSSVNALATR
ncbi:MAG TPA: hypothetical protein VMJ32_15620 [Pirellulales bacterium]|nr:hypothetical protein [Pirellulales bacterium]